MAGCSEQCQLSGELVQEARLDWPGCRTMGLELVDGTDPVILCEGSGSVTVGRVDALGRELWTDTWVEPDSASVRAVDLAVGVGGGEIVIAGEADFSSNAFADLFHYVWVRRYHEDGGLVWQRNLRREGAYAGGVCVDVEGRVYLSYADGEIGVLLRLDGLTGETVWRRDWAIEYGPLYEGVIACTEDGPVVANDIEWWEPRNRLTRLRAYDSEGELRWSADQDVDPSGWDQIGALGEGPEGTLSLGGYVEHDESYDYHPSLGRYDASGAQLFTWEAEDYGKVRDVAADAVGRSYVYAIEDDDELPGEEDLHMLRVYQVGAQGESGWRYEQPFTAVTGIFAGGIAADDHGRVVLLERWDDDEGEPVELVWIGQ